MAPNERPCRTFGWLGSKPDGAHQAFNRHSPRGDAKREQQHVDALLSRQVDGLIVVGADTHPRPSLGTNLPVPVVYAYAPSTDPMDVSVTADNAGAAAMAIDHLLACGRRNVAHISGDRAHKSAQDRAQGATATLAAAGASLAGDGALFGSWNEVWGRGAARILVERHPDIDGILCGSDQIARGVLDALRDMGKNVPADIAVVGLGQSGGPGEQCPAGAYQRGHELAPHRRHRGQVTRQRHRRNSPERGANRAVPIGSSRIDSTSRLSETGPHDWVEQSYGTAPLHASSGDQTRRGLTKGTDGSSGSSTLWPASSYAIPPKAVPATASRRPTRKHP